MDIYHSQIWGEISFYQKVKNEKEIFIEAHENYQKRTSRNRYKIATAQGIQTLSIPLKKGKNNQTPIQEVAISYDDYWINKHINALKTAYHKAPYFEHYFPYMEDLLKQKHTYLFDLNVASMRLIIKLLQLPINISLTTSYQGVNTLIDSGAENLPYPQVFEYLNGFTPDCSIIDLLLCAGPESILYL